jgi:aminopeptidase N
MRTQALLAAVLAGALWSPILKLSADDDSIFARIRREHQEVQKHCRNQGRDPEAEVLTGGGRFSALAQTAQGQPVDVSHYRLQIRLEPEQSSFSGSVTIEGEATAPVQSVSVDAAFNLTIESVKLFDSPAQFSRVSDRLSVAVPGGLAAGEQFRIAIVYRGLAVTVGRLGGGMLISDHGSARVMATLSEPYAAPTWWPCMDDARDKATVEVEATAPEGYDVASNGLLESTRVNPDQSVTCSWRTIYPMSTYLVSVAATNYSRFEDSYLALDGVTRMPLVYYVYPEHLDLARQKFAVTRRALEIFAPLFGEYPFVEEKYGMAEFPWGGAMEHQTMTSLGQSIVGSATNNGSGVIAHELAHQWWGDLVTMRTWDDIWLNEGFATYSEVLFYERHLGLHPGELMEQAYDDGQVMGALGGTVTAENAADPFDDRGAIYTKGAWVLHMMRHLLGDQKFFDALRDYRARHEFGNASTADLKQAFERKFGSELDWFFDQWVYSRGRPSYKLSANISGTDAGGQFTIKLTLKQKQAIEIAGRAESVFIVPLDVTIHYRDGSFETRRIFNDARKQKFTFTVSKRPDSVGLDEGSWVLKRLKQG